MSIIEEDEPTLDRRSSDWMVDEWDEVGEVPAVEPLRQQPRVGGLAEGGAGLVDELGRFRPVEHRPLPGPEVAQVADDALDQPVAGRAQELGVEGRLDPFPCGPLCRDPRCHPACP